MKLFVEAIRKRKRFIFNLWSLIDNRQKYKIDIINYFVTHTVAPTIVKAEIMVLHLHNSLIFLNFLDFYRCFSFSYFLWSVWVGFTLNTHAKVTKKKHYMTHITIININVNLTLISKNCCVSHLIITKKTIPAKVGLLQRLWKNDAMPNNGARSNARTPFRNIAMASKDDRR